MFRFKKEEVDIEKLVTSRNMFSRKNKRRINNLLKEIETIKAWDISADRYELLMDKTNEINNIIQYRLILASDYRGYNFKFIDVKSLFKGDNGQQHFSSDVSFQIYHNGKTLIAFSTDKIQKFCYELQSKLNIGSSMADLQALVKLEDPNYNISHC